MAHESFEDPGIAAVMNAHFVNVKVDREERPDVDQIYQSALALMGEQGGWPLTMFLTPEGGPFFGGTHFPPTARYGRPGFRDLLAGIAKAWEEKQDAVAHNVTTLTQALAEQAKAAPGPAEIPLELMTRIAERLAQEFDPIHGGIRGAPKFPQCSILAMIWRTAMRDRSAALGQVVTLALDRMSQGGIYDHLGGGYARYSTDAQWLVPHFEKMLYDNAQLLDLLTEAWKETGAPLYAQRAAETIGWLEREMMAEGGCFAATLDADSEGVEGKFYVWTEAEIDALLGPEAAAFKAAYDVTPHGNWEERTILNRSKHMLLGDAAHEAKLARGRAVLMHARDRRIRPGRDDKVLADWNGLMIAALARAGLASGRADWIALGRRAFDGVVSQMTSADGRLRHALRQGRLAHPATLDDYAAMIRAAAALHEATGDPALIAQAEAWAAILDAHYRHPSGGYWFAADDAGDLIQRPFHANDNATPSGNGLMAEASARLFALTGDPAWRARAEGIVAAFSGALEKNFFPLATLIGAAETLARPLAVVIAGAAEDPAAQALLRATQSASRPTLVLQQVPPGTALPPDHPAHGKGAVKGKPAAYLCEGPVCSPPVTEAAALEAMIKPG